MPRKKEVPEIENQEAEVLSLTAQEEALEAPDNFTGPPEESEGVISEPPTEDGGGPVDNIPGQEDAQLEDAPSMEEPPPSVSELRPLRQGSLPLMKKAGCSRRRKRKPISGWSFVIPFVPSAPWPVSWVGWSGPPPAFPWPSFTTRICGWSSPPPK